MPSTWQDVYAIGKAFMDKNYALWDDQSRRPELKALYKSNSTLSFQAGDSGFAGDEIYDGIFGLIPQTTKHEIASVDVQGNADDMVVLVTGRAFIGGSDDPTYFSEVFQLAAERPGDSSSLYILKDVIRITKEQ
ncbi:Nuclear transport factor 2A [Pseudocercospora fuligena]|uniref:NTF2-related export protein n=1 Tax=Pseudocercospora fuligena TaxID=685502 RepID=A0A8H6RQV5_9PEZI|nr:Nuclear transport factor 2A [Pseudocercospora fuligena]